MFAMNRALSRAYSKRVVVAACMTISLATAGVGTLALPAVAGPGAPAGAVGPGLSMRSAFVPTSSLPVALRAEMATARGNLAATTLVVEMANGQYPAKCLDANSAGTTAGQNGDKVQLWGCFDDPGSHANQWWVPVQTASGYTELANFQYPSKCLDADNSHGFVDGAKVQLWGCFNDESSHPNQWWNFGPDGFFSVLPNRWGSGAKVLDANNAGTTAGQNGDKVQLWRSLGGANQSWFQ
jgi:hypothetical protein